MQLSGEAELNATRSRTWDLLMDVEQLASCGPGVDAIERHDATHATLRTRIALGFMTAGVVVDLELAEIEAPDRVVVRGRGEASGNQVETSGEIRLTGPPDGPTRLAWTADLELHGPLAGFGARMIEGPATRIIGETLDCLRAKLAAT